MKRSTIDRLISSAGILIALVLILVSGAAFFAHQFIHSQVTSQLSNQKITFPEAGSNQLAALSSTDQEAVAKYAGQQLTTGVQARVFADNYIAAHLRNIGGGQTYAELSAASMANPTDAKLAKTVDSVFKGETLRGMLLNAYAFDTMAIVAYFVAGGALIAAILLLVLAILGFDHAKRSKRKKR